jgi:hypothetical protein
MPIVGDVERAERASFRRARIFPWLGAGLIVGDALLSGLPGNGLETAVPWVCVFLAGFLLILSGGVWPGSLYGLLNDESTRAHRAWALSVGHYAAVACGCCLLVAASVLPLSAAQCLRILLTVAIGAPLISFGIMERTALADG